MGSKVNECHRCSVEHDDPVLDREIELQEIARCVRKLKNNKTGGSDGLVGESFSSMLVELAGFSFHRANVRLYPRGTRYVSIASC